MGVILAPVKVDAWKQWVEELNGPRKEGLTDFKPALRFDAARGVAGGNPVWAVCNSPA